MLPLLIPLGSLSLTLSRTPDSTDDETMPCITTANTNQEPDAMPSSTAVVESPEGLTPELSLPAFTDMQEARPSSQASMVSDDDDEQTADPADGRSETFIALDRSLAKLDASTDRLAETLDRLQRTRPV